MSKKKKQNFGDVKRAAAKSAEANKSNNQARKRSMAVEDIDARTDEQVIAEVRAIYDSSRRDDHHEPGWIAMFLAGAVAYHEGDNSTRKAKRKRIVRMRSYIRSVANSPELVTRRQGTTSRRTAF